MPRIEEYVPRVNPDFTAGAGNAPAELGGGIYKGIGSGLHDIGEALSRYGEQQETSQLHVAATNLQTQAFTDWENLKQNGDITDPEQVQQFNEDYSNKLQSLTDNITSPAVRNHANELLASMGGEMNRRTLIDHATAVGEQAAANFEQVRNSLSNAVAADPDSYEALRGQADMLVGASGLPANKVPEAQARVRKELAEASIKGMAESGDVNLIRKAQSDVKSGRFGQDLDQSQETTTLRLLHQQEDIALHAQKQDAENAAKEEELGAQQARSDYMGGIQMRPNGELYVNKDWFLNLQKDPRLKGPHGGAVLNELMGVYRGLGPEGQQARRDEAEARRAQTGLAESGAHRSLNREAAYDQFYQRIKNGDTVADGEITHGVRPDGISPAQSEFLLALKGSKDSPMGAQATRMYDAQVASARAQLNAQFGSGTPEAAEGLASFKQWYTETAGRALRQSRSDPHSMVNPNNPATVLQTLTSQAQDMINTLKGGKDAPASPIGGASGYDAVLRQNSARTGIATPAGVPTAPAPTKSRPSLDSIFGR